MVGIYKVTCLKNKRVYIGQSMNIAKRIDWYQNVENSRDQPRIYNSFKKYGLSKHKFEVVVECDISELNKWERYYQDLFSTCGNNGLNCVLTGYNDRSGAVSEETKDKIRKTLTGLKRSEEFKRGVSERMKKHVKTDSQRLAASIRLKGHTPWNKGVAMSQESKDKMIASKLGLNTGENSSNNKIVFDTQTGVYYFNAKDAAEFNNISYKLLSRYLTGQRRNKTSLIYA